MAHQTHGNIWYTVLSSYRDLRACDPPDIQTCGSHVEYGYLSEVGAGLERCQHSLPFRVHNLDAFKCRLISNVSKRYLLALNVYTVFS